MNALKLIAFLGSVLAATHSVNAQAADPAAETLKKITGNYLILEIDGNTKKGGDFEVISNATEMGFAYTVRSPRGTTTRRVVTDTADTKLTETANTLTQEYSKGDTKTKIAYEKGDGFLNVSINLCKQDVCELFDLVASAGKAPGTPQDSKKFFSQIQGEYKIEKALGKAPKAGNENGVIDTEASNARAEVSFPICSPNGNFCDAGDINFTYANTLVYRQDVTATHRVFYIIKTDKGVRTHYQWEEKDGKFAFRNYQYSLEGVITFLEHELSK